MAPPTGTVMGTITITITGTATIMSITMITVTAMIEADAGQRARLAAWFSPGYPVGGFAYSHGLETLVAEGAVHDPDTLRDWIGTILGQGAGRSDAILLAHAWRAPDDPAPADLAAALQPSAERRLESRAQGAAFAAVTAAAWPASGLDGAAQAYPVAVGRAAAAHGLPLGAVLHHYLQAMAANLVSAGIRLIPIGQTDGQRVLAALIDTIAAVAAEAEAATEFDIGGFVLRADIASMRHETLHTRLFRS